MDWGIWGSKSWRNWKPRRFQENQKWTSNSYLINVLSPKSWKYWKLLELWMFQNLVGFPSYEKLAVLRTKDPNIGEAMTLSDRLCDVSSWLGHRAVNNNRSLSRSQLKTILKDFEQYVDTGKQYRDRNVVLSKILKSLNLYTNCIS